MFTVSQYVTSAEIVASQSHMVHNINCVEGFNVKALITLWVLEQKDFFFK